jgi:hypothetical protein
MLKTAEFLRSLAGCGFHPIFTAAEGLQEAVALVAGSICLAKTFVAPAFCAKWPRQLHKIRSPGCGWHALD